MFASVEALSGRDKDTVRQQRQHLSNDLKAVIDAGGRYLLLLKISCL
jgi:hypothetical protein